MIECLHRTLVALLLIIGFDAVAATSLLRADLKAAQQIDREIAEPSGKALLLEKQLHAIVVKVDKHGRTRLSDDDARDFYTAASLTSFYAHGTDPAETLRSAFDELRRRKIAPANAAQDVAATYVAARLFDRAKAFADGQGSTVAAQVPRFNDASSGANLPTLLDVADNGAVLSRRDFRLEQGAKVVVVSSPWCHFSRLATQAIEGDPALAALMTKNATWVMSQQLMSDIRGIAQWNAAHPASVMRMIYRQEEWPQLTSAATPTFYFFRDGRLMSSFAGWSGDARKDDLKAALQSLGVSTAGR